MKKQSPWEVRQKFIYLKCKSIRKKKQKELEIKKQQEQKEPTFKIIKKLSKLNNK